LREAPEVNHVADDPLRDFFSGDDADRDAVLANLARHERLLADWRTVSAEDVLSDLLVGLQLAMYKQRQERRAATPPPTPDQHALAVMQWIQDRTAAAPSSPPGDYIDQLRKLIGEIVERARTDPPEPVEALLDEYEFLIDFVFNGP
jgi:hypothetical protein